jgi:flavin reductase (DIM6/NTAB) family NADH-FMN oxidoreductase RutF
MGRYYLYQPRHVLYIRASGTPFLPHSKTEYGIRHLTTKSMAFATDWCGVRSGKDYNKFEEMKLTPGKAKIVSAPIIEESPLCIECRVKEIISLGSHDMFIADVVNVKADDKYLNAETGKFELSEANPLVYVHGGYFELGPKIGKFGWSVEKNRSQTKEKS